MDVMPSSKSKSRSALVSQTASGSFQGAAAVEYREPAEEFLLRRSQQVVAQIDRGAQGLLPVRHVSRSACLKL